MSVILSRQIKNEEHTLKFFINRNLVLPKWYCKTSIETFTKKLQKIAKIAKIASTNIRSLKLKPI